MSLVPAQIEGARFLASRRAAGLWDIGGFGKTAQAVAATDMVFARKILVVTTASARANWLREFRMWSAFPRSGAAIYTTKEKVPQADVIVVGWSNVIASEIKAQLAARHWDALILDEAHKAKSLQAKATQTVYGALAPRARQVWCLTGTPCPNAPNDLYPMLRTLFPEALEGRNYDGFLARYCVTKPRLIGGRWIEVVTGGKNEDELSEKLKPFFLRRKTEGLPGIRYSVYPLRADNPKILREAEADVDAQAILDAAETGDTRELEMHLGPLRRITGRLKAHAVVDLLKEEFENGLDKIVLFHWHTEVGRILREGLSAFGVVGIDGSADPHARQDAVDLFRTRNDIRIFVGQIAAAGEAITLTAANQCLFVEPSFVPKDMAQAAWRIYRRGQTRLCVCRIAALEGSIDEALMSLVRRKVASIVKVLGDDTP